MVLPSTKRIRDPIHNLIVFNDDNETDALAWKLIGTAEFQRLRRIKQLGFSEHVFPGATHSRFAHCIGVYRNARKLVDVINRLAPDSRDEHQSQVALLAALLHDIGHGPFSHAFEEAQKARLGKKNTKRHELWTAEIITRPDGEISALLGEARAREVAELLKLEVPQSMYHAIVSSSFDADRLDYLERDRFMTGTRAGAIDFDWLLNNLLLEPVPLGADDDEAGVGNLSFAFAEKATRAAEAFLLARYQLYEQVYLHRTTRGLEVLFSAALRRAADLIAEGRAAAVGIGPNSPLARFFVAEGETVPNYLDLDDTVMWAAVNEMRHSEDPVLACLAARLHRRDHYRCLDLSTVLADRDEDEVHAVELQIMRAAGDRLGVDVLKDQAPLSLYGLVGADDEKAHKKLRIRTGDGRVREINNVSKLVDWTKANRKLTRFYASSSEVLDELRVAGDLK